MDLSDKSVRAAESATINIKNPKDGSPTDIFIEVAGSDSDQYKKAFREYRKELVTASKSSGDDGLSDGQTAKILGGFLSDITLSWEGVAWEGKPLKCTSENKQKVYCDRSLAWLAEQVDKFTSERRNFLGN